MERATVDKAAQPKGVEGSTVAEAFELTASANPDRVALRTRGGESETTWGEYLEQVDRVALGLRGLGVERGDVVALMLTNRPEFHLADTAAMSLGATPFSLYQTLAPEQIAYQVNDSSAEVIVTEPAFLANVKAALGETPERQARRARGRRRVRGGHDPLLRPARDRGRRGRDPALARIGRARATSSP